MDIQEVDIKPVRDIVSKSGDDQDTSLIAILQETQDEYGYLPKPVLKEISRLKDIPLTRIFGVVTFYSQFSLIPKGKYTIRVCIGTACHVRGAEDIKSRIKELLGVEEGETTADYMFTLESVACVGVCALGPVVVVGSSKKTGACCDSSVGASVSTNGKFYGKVKPEKVDEILENYSKD